MPPRTNERVRQQPGGDLWALEHRDQLGGEYYMQDLDGHLTACLFEDSPSDQLFFEYVTDAMVNRYKTVREFAVVALFDRKNTERAALAHSNTLPSQFNLWLARTLSLRQPEPVGFYYVVGEQPPWQMISVDTLTGAWGERLTYAHGQWKTSWEKAGLTHLRRVLTQWLRSPGLQPVSIKAGIDSLRIPDEDLF